MTFKFIATAILTTLMLIFSTNAYADMCEMPIPKEGLRFQEKQLIKSWCHPSTYDSVIMPIWNGFDFEYSYWNDGFGATDICNYELPLGRTFNALILINEIFHYGSKRRENQSWLSWAMFWTRSTRAKCFHLNNPNSQNFAYAYGLPGRIYLYINYFYKLNGVLPTSRAGMFIHEVAHLTGKIHRGTCNGLSCDKRWDSYGPYYYETFWMLEFYTKHPKTFPKFWIRPGSPPPTGENLRRSRYTSAYRLGQLRVKINSRLTNKFESDPRFRVKPRNRGWILATEEELLYPSWVITEPVDE